MNGLAYLGAVGVTGRLARLLLQFSLAILLSNTSIGLGQNRVLDLDGNGSAVQLPPNIFNGLDQATIEAWVKFRDLSGSRFYSYGGFQQDLCVGRLGLHSGRDLDVFVNQGGQRDEVVGAGIIQTDVWYHVAAVLGPGGMQLAVNGVLAGTNASPACFSDLKNGD